MAQFTKNLFWNNNANRSPENGRGGGAGQPPARGGLGQANRLPDRPTLSVLFAFSAATDREPIPGTVL